jgi:hypothetical protein
MLGPAEMAAKIAELESALKGADNIVDSAMKEMLEAKAERNEVREAKDNAYRERDQLVAHLTKIYPSHLCRHPDEDEEWEDDWRWIICIHSPAGQLTWHIHDSELPMFYHLPERDNHWDGHSTEEKYERLDRCPMQWKEES